MELHLYNTATRSKSPFEPVDPERVTMYVCGPTVYNLVHIGNARPAVVFDVVFRLLTKIYGRVVYARNITDIDDKIIKAAQESGRSIEQITHEFTQAYLDDMAALGVREPSLMPHATHNIEAMQHLISRLIERGHAYEAENHVLFDVKSMAAYGELSNRKLEDMLEGARVEVAPYKRYAGDFVLWKPSSAAEPGWDSPWGRGRPGWHLECSAMIAEHLGERIDIHGGGRDLIFPHHENERAQSLCAHEGEHFVNVWMHNGYINIDGEKMSKSLGNFRTVRGLLEQFDGEVLRYALLSAHYRSDMDFSASLLEQAKASLNSLYGALRAHPPAEHPAAGIDLREQPAYHALLDDLNTPLALSELHALARQLNKAEGAKAQGLSNTLRALGAVLGLLQREPESWFKGEAAADDAEIDALVQARTQAKLDKDYALADQLRQELKDRGIELEDSKTGTSWRRI